MAKSSNSGCRRTGSPTRSVYTGGRPAQLNKPIYGSTPKTTVTSDANKLAGTRQAHTIGAPRDK